MHWRDLAHRTYADLEMAEARHGRDASHLPHDKAYGLAPTMAPKQNSGDPKVAAELASYSGAKGI